MAKKFWKTDHFAELNKEWDEILSRDGFEDAEIEVKGERYLKQFSHFSYWRRPSTRDKCEEKLTYAMLIAQFCSTEKAWADDSDRLIMEKTSDGWTIQEISKELKRLGKAKYNRDTIRYIRRRYENKWGIRTWQEREMVSRRIRTPS